MHSQTRIRHRSMLAVLATTAILSVAGCGSSKPSFCSETSKLEQSVKNVNVSGGLSSLKTQLQQIETNAKNVVSSASKDFPNETTAITNSLTKLQTDVKAITSSPTPQQIATVTSSGKAVVTAVNDFVNASKSKCK